MEELILAPVTITFFSSRRTLLVHILMDHWRWICRIYQWVQQMFQVQIPHKTARKSPYFFRTLVENKTTHWVIFLTVWERFYSHLLYLKLITTICFPFSNFYWNNFNGENRSFLFLFRVNFSDDVRLLSSFKSYP